MLGFLMLNPSTADEVKNDPTVTRCVRYAKKWGYGALWVSNIFAYRSTEPRILKLIHDPVGPGNDESIDMMFEDCKMVIAAWGEHGLLNNRSYEIRKKYKGRLYALRLNASGEPAHPLYLKKSLEPFEL